MATNEDDLLALLLQWHEFVGASTRDAGSTHHVTNERFVCKQNVLFVYTQHTLFWSKKKFSFSSRTNRKSMKRIHSYLFIFSSIYFVPYFVRGLACGELGHRRQSIELTARNLHFLSHKMGHKKKMRFKINANITLMSLFQWRRANDNYISRLWIHTFAIVCRKKKTRKK